jgi:hypothetical protein
MSKVIISVFTSLLFISCVSQSEHDKLKAENEILKEELEILKAEKREQEEKEYFASKQQHSEEEALKLIKDYYEFYNANFLYRKPKIRRISNDKFAISLEECIKEFRDIEFHWSSKVLNLTIHTDGTYDIN